MLLLPGLLRTSVLTRWLRKLGFQLSWQQSKSCKYLVLSKLHLYQPIAFGKCRHFRMFCHWPLQCSGRSISSSSGELSEESESHFSCNSIPWPWWVSTPCFCTTILQRLNYRRVYGGISPALQGVVPGISHGKLIPVRESIIPETNSELTVIITWLADLPHPIFWNNSKWTISSHYMHAQIVCVIGFLKNTSGKTKHQSVCIISHCDLSSNILSFLCGPLVSSFCGTFPDLRGLLTLFVICLLPPTNRAPFLSHIYSPPLHRGRCLSAE